MTRWRCQVVAAGQEEPLGETFEKMQKWKERTTAACEVVKVDATHMGCMKFGDGGAFDRLMGAIMPILEPLLREEATRKEPAAMPGG